MTVIFLGDALARSKSAILSAMVRKEKGGRGNFQVHGYFKHKQKPLVLKNL